MSDSPRVLFLPRSECGFNGIMGTFEWAWVERRIVGSAARCGMYSHTTLKQPHVERI